MPLNASGCFLFSWVLRGQLEVSYTLIREYLLESILTLLWSQFFWKAAFPLLKILNRIKFKVGNFYLIPLDTLHVFNRPRAPKPNPNRFIIYWSLAGIPPSEPHFWELRDLLVNILWSFSGLPKYAGKLHIFKLENYLFFLTGLWICVWKFTGLNECPLWASGTIYICSGYMKIRDLLWEGIKWLENNGAYWDILEFWVMVDLFLYRLCTGLFLTDVTMCSFTF